MTADLTAGPAEQATRGERIQAVVDQAGKLSPEQAAALRSLLPAPPDDRAAG